MNDQERRIYASLVANDPVLRLLNGRRAALIDRHSRTSLFHKRNARRAAAAELLEEVKKITDSD